MNKKFLKTITSLLIIFLFTSCEDPDQTATGSTSNDCETNTIGTDNCGVGEFQAPIASLFFDLNDNSLNYTYDFYSVSGIGYGNTINLPCSIRETDYVSLYTFPEYLLEAESCAYDNCGWCSGEGINPDISPTQCEEAQGIWVESSDELTDAENYISNYLLDETYGGLCSCWCVDSDGDMVDCTSNNAVSQVYTQGVPTQEGGQCQNIFITNQAECVDLGWIWFTDSIDCSLMDANQDCVMEDAQDTDILNVEIANFDAEYNNILKLVWDLEAGKYNIITLEEPIFLEETIIDSSDTYDINRYWTIIDEWENLDGKVYIDHSQWNDTTYVILEPEINCEEIMDNQVECESAGSLKGCYWNGDMCQRQECSDILDPDDCVGSCAWSLEFDDCRDDSYPVPVDITLDTTFEYTKSALNPDLLMQRINSDCNNDGIFTPAEDYVDTGVDGCPSIYELGDGDCACTYDISEELNQCSSSDRVCIPSYDCSAIDNENSCIDADNCSWSDTDPGVGEDFACTGYYNPLLCADGTDPNLDDWSIGLPLGNYSEDNGQYDCQSPYCNIEVSLDSYRGEPFIDRPDGLTRPEVFYDAPIGDTGVGNGQWQGQELEPWADLNCNFLYDGSADGTGNGIWDGDEIFQDLDFDGLWSVGEPLYSLSDRPNQIIVNYDTDNNGVVNDFDGEPQAIIEIDPDEINSVMGYLNGTYVLYEDIIQEQFIQDYQSYSYTPIQEIRTISSNEIIEDIPAPLINNEFNIAKTYWPTLPDGTDVDGNGTPDRYYDYDYHIYSYDEGIHQHLYKLVHPAYYYNPGFDETPDDIADGFFEISDLVKDTMLFATGNILRSGEIHKLPASREYVDANGDGAINHIYDVTREFTVEYDTLNVPMRKVLGGYTDNDQSYCDGTTLLECANGISSCPDLSTSSGKIPTNDCGDYIREITDCSADTLINAFRVTRLKNIVTIGSGTEYGERNTVWLLEGVGIVKDKLEIRWSGENGATDNWIEYSRLELKDYETSNSGFNLGRMLNSGKILELKDFQNQEGFDGDPYKPQPTAILQRVRINND